MGSYKVWECWDLYPVAGGLEPVMGDNWRGRPNWADLSFFSGLNLLPSLQNRDNNFCPRMDSWSALKKKLKSKRKLKRKPRIGFRF